MSETLKIVKLEAENIKRLRAVEITPSGALVEITGENGAGKTSVLDSIWWALQGAGNIQAEPIRRGADEARVTLDLGAYIVTRVMRRREGGDYTTSLTVASPEGARFPRPQDLLTTLFSGLTFDPLEFARSKPSEQFSTLARFVPGLDLEAIRAATEADYSARREENRTAKERRAAAAAIVIPEGFQAVDEGALLDAIAGAAAHNDEIAGRVRRRDEVAARIRADRIAAAAAAAKAERLRAEAEAADADARARTAQADADEARLAAAPPLPALVDVSELRAKLDAARRHNAAGARAEEKARLEGEAAAAEARAAALTAAIDEREATKRAVIESAALPVPGIGFGDGHITLNGVPFDQASDAEQLRASCAIAMAANPRLRILRVRDGSLLSPNSLEALAAMAAAANYQIWIETVASERPSAIVIVDGEIAPAQERGGA